MVIKDWGGLIAVFCMMCTRDISCLVRWGLRWFEDLKVVGRVHDFWCYIARSMVHLVGL